MRNKAYGFIILSLAFLQILLILGSWVVTSAMPELQMRSLLSSEGVRWFFGHFVSNLTTPLLVDIILLVVGIGCAQSSGLWKVITDCFGRRRLSFSDRAGLHVAVVELVVFVVVMILLTCVPHGILLSVTGHLFPSSFSISLIPVLSFAMVVCSLSFKVVSNHSLSMKQLCDILTYGITKYALLFPVYILAVELYSSVVFVFSMPVQ